MEYRRGGPDRAVVPSQFSPGVSGAYTGPQARGVIRHRRECMPEITPRYRKKSEEKSSFFNYCTFEIMEREGGDSVRETITLRPRSIPASGP